MTQFVYEVPQHLKSALLTHLLENPQMNTVLVFTRTKHGADKLARRLEGGNVRTATLHANRSQAQRLRALRAFKSGEVRVLVATDIAARGIDVDGISHVVNYDFPKHAEDYVHRIGRTGRANMVGDAISFVGREDQGPLRTLERFIGRGIVRKRAENFDYKAQPPPAPAGQGGGGDGGRGQGGGGGQGRGGYGQYRGRHGGGGDFRGGGGGYRGGDAGGQQRGGREYRGGGSAGQQSAGQQGGGDFRGGGHRGGSDRGGDFGGPQGAGSERGQPQGPVGQQRPAGGPRPPGQGQHGWFRREFRRG